MNEPKQKRRLSELIRAGAALRPQCFGSMFGMTPGREYGSCAIGAAYEAATGLSTCFSDSHAGEIINDAYPILKKWVRHLLLPSPWPLGIIITHLNDVEKFSREDIADWVEAIEAEEACKAMAKPEHVTV